MMPLLLACFPFSCKYAGSWNTVTAKIGVGYKPPPPAFQIGKALVGKVSARQPCRDVPNETESDKSTKTIRLHGQYKIQSYKMYRIQGYRIQGYRMNIRYNLYLGGT
jgi:hypothetical protein